MAGCVDEPRLADVGGKALTPQQFVQQRTAASGSSFYYAFLFLPSEQRAAITAFYAFCREIDDVVDEVHEVSVAAAKLAWWRSEVHQAFAGQPSHPITQALMPFALRFKIQAEQLLAVIEGCQMDLDQSRYLDFTVLQRYCHLGLCPAPGPGLAAHQHHP